MLNIYKASAGSGKTFTLTGEYIKALFKHQTQYSYKYILAVTFTNKATDEMKQRIMEELYHLSLDDMKSPYLDDLIALEIDNENDWRRERGVEEIDVSDAGLNRDRWERRVRDKAKKLMIAILHDYSAFRISTIDQFFQVVMRSFAREMGKMATYNVELDSSSVLLFAIDKMFADLDDEENAELLDRLKRFAIESANEGNRWDIKTPMLKLGGILFNDSFKDFLTDSKLPDIVQVEKLKTYLQDIKQDFAQRSKSIGERGMELFREYGLSPTDMKGASRSPFKKFEEWASGVIPERNDGFIDLDGRFDKWYSGKKPGAGMEALYNNGMSDLVHEAVKLYTEDIINYNTANIVLPYLNTIAVLGEIYKRIMEYCRENNIMLLSESTQLLNRIIDGSDTPFVYEKIGGVINNYMLDEFQDTSSLQWRNFYPLLNDSLSGGNDNLIVGDVKQSIYRWRGSDWNILNSRLGESFRGDIINEHSLDYNWRSGGNIVRFNNLFFKRCADEIQTAFNSRYAKFVDTFKNRHKTDINDIYSNFEQYIPDKAEGCGYVEIDIVEGSKITDFQDNASKLLVRRIRELVEIGIPQSDIAVLVRKKSEGALVAEMLVKSGFSVISADSLKLGSSPLVQKIINILRDIAVPNDPKNALYDIFYGAGVFERDKLDSLGNYTLYNICEEIIRVFLDPSEKEDLTYIQALLDSVAEFSDKYGTNIRQFIKWWDESGCDKNILLPEGIDAVTVMTIHKSKGLGFNIVFVPFFDFSISNKNTDFWSKMKGFDEYDGPVALPFKQGMAKTIFYDEYFLEYLYQYVDNLNVAYVALTRPKRGLYVFARGGRDDGIRSVESPGDTMFNIVEDFDSKLFDKYYLSDVETFVDSQENVKVIAIGKRDLMKSGDYSMVKSETLSLQSVLNRSIDEKRLRTSLRTGSIAQEVGIREEGIILHKLFSKIDTIDDLTEICRELSNSGLTKLNAGILIERVNSKLAVVEAYRWFDKGCKSWNERGILTKDGREFRPDRVVVSVDGGVERISVIDYKFGEYNPLKQSYKGYVRQVEQYVALIKDMGYKNVEGYLWFVMADKVDRVV